MPNRQQSKPVNNTEFFDGLNHIVGFGYDARSNLTSDGVRNFAFDILNRMTSFSESGNNGTLTYEPEGRLVSQVINGVTASFLYDGTEMIAEYNSAGTVLRKYVHSTRDDDPQVWLEGAGNGDIRHVYANYQGSVVATTNAAGSAVQIYKYGPYGEPKDGAGNPAWNGFRFRYTGQQIIPEAKLYYYKARVYDPNLGIFLQTDPIGTKDDLNLYSYVKGDPINHVDPDGMIVETIWDAANVAMGVASAADNISNGRVIAGAVDVGGVLLDVAATVIPAVPGGAGSVIKAARAADEVGDAYKSLKSSTELGDMVKTPANSEKSFTKLPNGQGFKDKKTGIIFQKSNTNHSKSPDGEYKAGTKKGEPPTKGNKDTITGGEKGGCLIKKDRC